MEENDISIEERILEIFRELPIQKQEQIIHVAEFLVWREQKQNAGSNEADKKLVED